MFQLSYGTSNTLLYIVIQSFNSTKNCFVWYHRLFTLSIHVYEWTTRFFFLTFQSLSYPLTLMTLEDLIKKKKVFPQNFRYLFWSDWGFYPKIEVSDLLGLNRRTVVSDDMLSPRGMAIDYKENLLYWVDSHKNTIESVQFNGNSRRIIVSHAGAKFFGVAVFEVQLVQTNFKLISCSWDN